ncbi:MAG TPA: PepSY domain-containing protein [Chryseosolibacter sp.]|nr:PepSY domain-containing protein [Chryseosolibacter sp.]
MLKKNQRLIRRSHRFLGIFIGIQFLFWTISGLFFSWSDIDEVHGDHMRKVPKALAFHYDLASPSLVLDNLRKTVKADSINAIRLISVVGEPVYQVAYFSGHAGDVHPHAHYVLANARTGKLRDPLSRDEALALARDHVASGATLKTVRLLERTGAEHEYRDRPLPAWAVSFENPDCTVYISAEQGTFQAIRNDHWRAFDFLWMFHTMDFESRDDINNWVLRGFSILGLVTVLSGFLLFFASWKRN